MPAKKSLLMEIRYPDGSAPLYLMTGQGFELLREDKGGREIYGIRHNEKDYLFFPFSFKPVDAGVLSMHMPPEYEESCLDHKADGAKIIFGSVHGVPFFPEMPDEYKTNTGTIRVSSSGTLRIHLDKAEEGQPPFGEGHCGCGHEHHHKHQRRDGQNTLAGEDCGCGHAHHGNGHSHQRHEAPDAPTGSLACPRKASDEELADTIRRAADALNEALRQGFEAGLSLHLHTSPRRREMDDAEQCPAVHIRRIARPL